MNKTTNCFTKAGFNSIPAAKDCEEEDKLTLSEYRKNGKNSKNMKQFVEDAKLEDYLEIDIDICIAEHPSDAHILEDARKKKKKHEIDKVKDEGNEEKKNEGHPKSSHDEIIKALQTNGNEFQFQGNVY